MNPLEQCVHARALALCAAVQAAVAVSSVLCCGGHGRARRRQRRRAGLRCAARSHLKLMYI
eukprot:2869653-Pleurochrysis_carterae.AAC.1